jgi:hypothetical protein
MRFVTNGDVIGQVIFTYAHTELLDNKTKVYELEMWLEEGDNEYVQNFDDRFHEN